MFMKPEVKYLEDDRSLGGGGVGGNVKLPDVSLNSLALNTTMQSYKSIKLTEGSSVQLTEFGLVMLPRNINL